MQIPYAAQQKRWLQQSYLNKLVEAEKEWQTRALDISNGTKYSMMDILEQRGFVNQIVGDRDDFKKLLDNRRVGVYCGIDPTADSMHVGHMVPFMALSWMYIHGYSVKFLLGGATARIGDPEGRLTARNELSRVDRKINVAQLQIQLKRFGESMERYARRHGYEPEWAWKRELVNNDAWHSKLTWFDLMWIMGRYVRLGPMLGRDSVKNRLEHGDGMSFSEFSYPLIQAWDWWHMYQRGTQVQIGGADQFGNILQGAEAVKAAARNDQDWQDRMHQDYKNIQEHSKVEVTEDPMGFTVPLLTTASGEKFGKSAGNAVWLDPAKTTVFELYQFWLRTADADVEKYMKLFTFLSLEAIEAIMLEHQKDASKRVAQHKLASEFTELIHGIDEAKSAEAEHRALFSKNLSLEQILTFAKTKEQQQLSSQSVESPASITNNAKPQDMEKYGTVRAILPASAVIGQPMARVLRAAGLVQTNSEGQRLINNKGAYIGGKLAGSAKVADDEQLSYTTILLSDWNWWQRFIIDDKLLILRVGKWRIKIIEIVSDERFAKEGLTYPGMNDAVAAKGSESIPAAEQRSGRKRGLEENGLPRAANTSEEVPVAQRSTVNRRMDPWDQSSKRGSRDMSDNPWRRPQSFGRGRMF